MDCTCIGCAALEAEYRTDPVLLAFLKRRLLKRGWAGGQPSPAEKAYQKAHCDWANQTSSLVPFRSQKTLLSEGLDSESGTGSHAEQNSAAQPALFAALD
jgi:hypothetical protein